MRAETIPQGDFWTMRPVHRSAGFPEVVTFPNTPAATSLVLTCPPGKLMLFAAGALVYLAKPTLKARTWQVNVTDGAGHIFWRQQGTPEFNAERAPLTIVGTDSLIAPGRQEFRGAGIPLILLRPGWTIEIVMLTPGAEDVWESAAMLVYQYEQQAIHDHRSHD